MPSIQDFMDSSLVIWIQTFRPTGETLDFEELCDGVFLNDVLHQIDERPIMESINRSAIDVNARIQNWRCLLKNISNFYQETLQQLIVQKLPDIVMIAREPEKDTSIEELTKILKLLLGSAVQCDKKEGYISIIQDLDKDIQQTLVDYIKEVTNQATFMFDVELENLNISEIHEIFHNLKSLVTQRDELIEVYQDLIQEREYYRCLVDDHVKDISLPSHMDTQHVTGELMLYKNQIKCLQQEIEETNYSFSELKSDKEEYEFNYGRLLTENERLSEELRTLGINRDELDILQEQAHLGSVFETENFHLKAKVAELEFYKSRTEELRQDNTALIDSRARFEEQLEKSRKKKKVPTATLR